MSSADNRRDYTIGQIVPLDYQERPLHHGHGTAAWYGFQTPPLKEASAKAWVEHRGLEAWYPSETRWRRIPRGKRKRAPYEARIVPRYIFVRFPAAPNWSEIRRCRWLSRVIGVGGNPLPITDLVLSEMEGVPANLEAIRKREAFRRIIRPGDRVRIKSGAMVDYVVEVSDVHAGIARFIIPLLGDKEMTIETTRLTKVQSIDG